MTAKILLQLPPDASDMLRAALVRRSPQELVLVFTPELGVSVDTREAHAGHLKAHGCYELARKLTQAVVPRDSILCFVNSNKGTNVTTAKVSDLLGPPVAPPPPWRRMGTGT